jgi:urease accessory protein
LNDLRLLHLCDSLFPLGGFAYSDGLEAATTFRLKPDTTEPPATPATVASSAPAVSGVDRAAVVDEEGLRDWIDVCLDETIGRLEGPALWRAWPSFRDGDWDAIAGLDEELTALRPSASARRSSRAMGLRLLTTWQALHPDARLAEAVALARAGRFGPALSVAFAGVCACAGIERRRSAEAFAYTRLASTISAAMRLMPIGQADAHARLARALDRVPAVIDAVIARDGDGALLESFSPAMDLAAMTQQYLHSRLFRS